MVSGRSRIIGLVVAYLNNQFYPEALEKLSKRLQERGYHVLVFMTAKTQGDVSDVIEEILDYQVDGIIAASVALSSELSDRCRSEQVPLVLFNRSQDVTWLVLPRTITPVDAVSPNSSLLAGIGGSPISPDGKGRRRSETARPDLSMALRLPADSSFARGVGNFEAGGRGAGSARDVHRMMKFRTPCSWQTIIWRSR